MGRNKKSGRHFASTLQIMLGESTKTDPLFAKNHVLSLCLGTSLWVGRFCCKVHTKHNQIWLVKG